MTRFHSQWFRFQWLRIFGAITAITFIVSATTTAQVQPVYTALNSVFESGGYTPDIWPSGYLALGQDGNFYGTTNFNQSNIYMMTPSGVETLLWESGQGAGDQCEWGADGIFYGGLTLGSDGTFYGVCAMWGNDSAGYYISYNGGSSVNVFSPFSTSNTSPNPLILAPDGNLYGTTVNGGTYGTGSVIKLTPSGELTTLYSFKEGTASGYNPEGPLALGRNGDLYGTTPVGGLVDTDGAAGVFFQITTKGKFKVLYTFPPSNLGGDGLNPTAGVTLGNDGNFYGTTNAGGANGEGIIFKISAAGKKLTKLHDFNNKVDNAGHPIFPLTLGSDGNFYGASPDTASGGFGPESLFEITPKGVYTDLYDGFGSPDTCPYESPQGCLVSSPLTQHPNGSFYGTTGEGGVNDGVFFSLNVGLKPFVALQFPIGAPGSTLGIFGQGFSQATAVSFNGTAATFNVVSDTYMTAKVPTGAKLGYVTVTEGSTSLKSNMEFDPK